MWIMDVIFYDRLNAWVSWVASEDKEVMMETAVGALIPPPSEIVPWFAVGLVAVSAAIGLSPSEVGPGILVMTVSVCWGGQEGEEEQSGIIVWRSFKLHPVWNLQW